MEPGDDEEYDFGEGEDRANSAGRKDDDFGTVWLIPVSGSLIWNGIGGKWRRERIENHIRLESGIGTEPDEDEC